MGKKLSSPALIGVQVGEDGMDIDVDEKFYEEYVYPSLTETIKNILIQRQVDDGVVGDFPDYEEIKKMVIDNMKFLGLDSILGLQVLYEKIQQDATVDFPDNASEEAFFKLMINNKKVQEVFKLLIRKYKLRNTQLKLIFGEDQAAVYDNLMDEYFYEDFLRIVRKYEIDRNVNNKVIKDVDELLTLFGKLGLTSYSDFKKYVETTDLTTSPSDTLNLYFDTEGYPDKVGALRILRLVEEPIKEDIRELLKKVERERLKLVKIITENPKITYQSIDSVDLELSLIDLKGSENIENDRQYKIEQIKRFVRTFKLDTIEGRALLKNQLENRYFESSKILFSGNGRKNASWRLLGFKREDITKLLRTPEEQENFRILDEKKKQELLEEKQERRERENSKKKESTEFVDEYLSWMGDDIIKKLGLETKRGRQRMLRNIKTGIIDEERLLSMLGAVEVLEGENPIKELTNLLEKENSSDDEYTRQDENTYNPPRRKSYSDENIREDVDEFVGKTVSDDDFNDLLMRIQKFHDNVDETRRHLKYILRSDLKELAKKTGKIVYYDSATEYFSDNEGGDVELLRKNILDVLKKFSKNKNKSKR